MIVAGSSASVTTFAGSRSSVLKLENLACEAEVADIQTDVEIAADAGDREPPLIVGLDRSRPGAEPFRPTHPRT